MHEDEVNARGSAIIGDGGDIVLLGYQRRVAEPPRRPDEGGRLRGMAVRTDGSNPSRSATNLVSETTKKLDLRRARFARDFRPLSAMRFRDRRQRRFWAICGPSAPENLELLFQWCGSLAADSAASSTEVARGRSSLSPVRDWRFRGGRNATGVKR